MLFIYFWLVKANPQCSAGINQFVLPVQRQWRNWINYMDIVQFMHPERGKTTLDQWLLLSLFSPNLLVKIFSRASKSWVGTYSVLYLLITQYFTYSCLLLCLKLIFLLCILGRSKCLQSIHLWPFVCNNIAALPYSRHWDKFEARFLLGNLPSLLLATT